MSHYLYTVSLNGNHSPTHFATIIMDTNNEEDVALTLVKQKIRDEFKKDPETVDIKFVKKY